MCSTYMSLISNNTHSLINQKNSCSNFDLDTLKFKEKNKPNN